MSDIALKVTSDSSQARKDLENLSASVGKIEKTTATATKTLAGLATSVTAAFGAFSALSAINRAADTFTNLDNKIALVVGRTRELAVVQGQLIAVAVRTRGSLESSVEVFNKFGNAMRNSGASTKQLLNATENVQKAVAISGTAGESSRAAIFQLGQALSSGQLRGEELNSVLEQTPRIAQAIADGIGASIGELRQLAADGKITSDVVFKALLSQTEKLNKEFELLTPTFAQATTRLKDSITLLLSEFSKSTGFTTAFAKSINSIAITIAELADVADVYLTVFTSRFQEAGRDIVIVGKAIGGLFSVVGQQIARIVPVIRTFAAPLTAIANSFLFDAIRKSFDDFYYSMFRTRNEVRGVVEALGLFVLFGDTRVSRTIGNIFRSDSVLELTKNINELTSGLDPTKLFNFLDIRISLRDKFIRPFYEGIAIVKSLGAAVGLVNNPIVEFSNIRFDRFIEAAVKSAELFTYTLEALVFPAVVKLSTVVAEFTLNSIEYIRSFLGIGPSLLSIIERSTKRIAAGLGLYATSALYLDTIAGALTGALTIFQSVPEGIINAYKVASKYFTLLVGVVIEKAGGLKKAEDIVKGFLTRVKEFFKDCWYAVVGGSYWPDLVEGVLSWANKLYTEGTSTIGKFVNFVKDSFNSLIELVGKLKFDSLTAGFAKVTGAFSKDALLSALKDFGELAKSSLEKGKEFVIEAKIKLSKLSSADLSNFLPLDDISTTVKRIATAVVLATLLAIASPAKFAAIAGAAVVSLEIALGQKISAALYGAFSLDFFREIGDTMGTVVGSYFASALQQVPDILRNIVTFADAFGHAFLDQFGIIGSAISGFIDIFSFGDTGILGFLLFGGGVSLILSRVESVKGFLSSSLTTLADIANKATGGKEGQGGILGQAFIGSSLKYVLGATAVVIAGFSDQMSTAAAIATATPLLVTAILGEDVTGKILKDSIVSVIGFFIKQGIGAAATLSKSKLGLALFGDIKSKDISDKLGKAKDTFSKVINNLNDTESRKAYLEGKQSLSDLLFGKETTSDIRTKFDDKIKAAADIAKQSASKFGDKIKGVFNNQSIIDKVVSGAGGANAADQASAYVNTVKSKFEQFSKTTEGLAGASGLLGKLITGKGFIIGSILAGLSLFASAAQAAETETKSSFSNISDSLLKFFGDYGIYALLVPPAGYALLVKLLRNSYTAITMAATGIATATSVVTVAINGATGAVGAFAGVTAVFTGGWANFLAKTYMGLKLLATGVTLAFGVVGAAIGAALAVLRVFLGTLFAFFISPVGLLILGLTAIAGTLSVLFFGEGDTFSKKLDSVIVKLGKIFSFKSSRQKEVESIIPKVELGNQPLDFSGKLSSINFDKMTDRQFDSMKALSGRLKEVIERAKEEEEDLGAVTAATAADLTKLQDLFNQKADKYAFNSSISDLNETLKQTQDRAQGLFAFLNKDLNRNVPFFSAFSFENLVLPFEQFIDRYTKFNDTRARDVSGELDKNIEIFKEINQYLKPEEIQASVLAFNRLNGAINDLSGLSGIFERVFGGYSKQKLELDLARKQVNTLGNDLKKLAEERAAAEKYQNSLLEAQKSLANLEKLRPGSVPKIELNELFGFDDPQQVNILSKDIEDLIKQLNSKAKNSEEAINLEVQISAKFENLDFQLNQSKIAKSLKSQLEDVFKRANTPITVPDFFKFAGTSGAKELQEALYVYTQRLQEAARAEALAGKDTEKLANAFLMGRDAVKAFNKEIERLTGNEGLSKSLSNFGVSLSRETIDAFGARGSARLQKFREQLENADTISADPRLPPNYKANIARQALAAKKLIQEEFQIRDFTENFSFQIGKTNLSGDLMKSLMLTPAESARASELLAQSLKDKNLLKGLTANVSGLPKDPQRAKEISDRIVGTEAEYAKIMQDKGKNILEVFSDSLSKGGSRIDLTEILRSNINPKDILDAQEFSKQIKQLQDQKDKFLLSRTNDPNGVTTLDIGILADFEKQIEVLNRKRDSTLDRNLGNKLEGLASKTGLTIGDEFLKGFAPEALTGLDGVRKKLEALAISRKNLLLTEGDTLNIIDTAALRENIKQVESEIERASIIVNGNIPTLIKKANYDIKPIDIILLGPDEGGKVKTLLNTLITQEKELATLSRETNLINPEDVAKAEQISNSIKTTRDSLERIKTAPKTFGDAFTVIGAATSLSAEALRKLDTNTFGIALAAAQEIDRLTKEINDTKLKTGSIDQDKIAVLQKQLNITQAISDQEQRRQQITQSFIGAGKDLIKNVLTGEAKPIKQFLDTFTGTVMDTFTTQLSNVLFKDVGNALGQSLGVDLFGELGSSPLKPIYTKSVDAMTNMLGGASGIGNLFTGFGGVVDKIGSGFNSFLNLFGMGNTFAPNMNLLAGAFAEGGMIPGAGTGAVPIIAHAGEVILNEAQQARVAAAMNQPAQQMINVNITGDISRQTKSEIYKMLPSIAEGVNSHNREKGLR